MAAEKKGRLLAEYGRVRVFDGFPFKSYDIKQPDFSPAELELAESLKKVLATNASFSLLEKSSLVKSKGFFDALKTDVLQAVNLLSLDQKLPDASELEHLRDSLEKALSFVKTSKAKELAVFVLQESVGYGFIAVPMADGELEEVMVNGFEQNVFVFHRKFGFCKTNIVVDGGKLFVFIQRIAKTIGKEFSEKDPLLDASLPDGNRANATFSYVTPKGHTLTIRKFTLLPLSVIDLIEKGTVSLEVAAFLWTMVEGMGLEPKNIIITGGSGSGKTTLMNILAGFIPSNNRIISIEDTLELFLGQRENWIQMESRPKIGDKKEVTMDELLKNTLRMRPDRIIVGEVRGAETQTLFVAMDTGHSGILGTMHSNSARECLVRLKSKPMDVPESMLPLLDLIIVMQRTYDKGRGVHRFVKHISEIGRMEGKTLLSNVFEFNPKTGKVEKTDVPSRVMDDFAERAGIPKSDLKREILVRQRILEWMLRKGARKSLDVDRIVQLYYSDPRAVLEMVTEDLFPRE